MTNNSSLSLKKHYPNHSTRLLVLSQDTLVIPLNTQSWMNTLVLKVESVEKVLTLSSETDLSSTLLEQNHCDVKISHLFALSKNLSLIKIIIIWGFGVLG